MGAVDVSLAALRACAMLLCDPEHLLAAGVEPDRIARGAKQSDAGEILDRHAVTDENGAVLGLESA